jgi:LmbE family N-acetylglucosaminyl deacetylase
MLRLALPDGPLRLLCLGAHADDIEIGCGGTVLRLLEEHPGSAVDWVVFNGEGERRREAEASAADFLAASAARRVAVHRFRDGFFPWEGAAIKERFEQLKAESEPNLVLTHWKGDAHQDHRTIAELTWNTWRDHLILEYEVPKMEGDLGNPSLFVPLSAAHVARKLELLARHFGTQRSKSWFSEETFRGLLRLRGVNAGSEWAEGFYLRRAVV